MAKPTDDREMPRDIVIVVDQDSDDPSQRRIHLSYPARGGLEFANDLMRRWLMIGPDLAATTFSAWFEQRTALPLRASVHFGEGTHDDPLVSIKLGVSGEAQQTAAKMLYLALYTIKDKIQHLPEEHQATVAETVQRGFDILQRGTELTDDVLQQGAGIDV